MKEQIRFMSSLFDTANSVPPIANDRHFGEDLARWMAKKSQYGEFTFGPPEKSDAGWSETVTANGESIVIGFGLVDGSAGTEYAEWLITIGKPRSWKSFGSNDSPSRSRLCDHIHNVLRDERGIREVQWG